MQESTSRKNLESESILRHLEGVHRDVLATPVTALEPNVLASASLLGHNWRQGGEVEFAACEVTREKIWLPKKHLLPLSACLWQRTNP